MHSYKSLVVVAGMGGVMVLMAGVLLYSGDLDTPDAARSTSSLLDSKAKFTRLNAGGTVGQAAPDKGLFKDDLAIIRRSMKPGENSFTNSSPSVKRALAHGRAVVSPADFELLESEIRQRKISDTYRSVLIVFLGASKSEKAVPILEEFYAKHPTRVIDALQLNSTTPALEAFDRLYYQAKNARERFCFLQVLKKLPSKFALDFVVKRLREETDPTTLKDTIKITRFIAQPEVGLALNELILTDDARSQPFFGIACNALAAQSRFGGADMLLDLHLDKANSEQLRQAAGNSIAFMKAPHLVQKLLTRLEKTDEVSASIGRFLFRNSQDGDLVALESFLSTKPGSQWRSVLNETLSRLRK